MPPRPSNLSNFAIRRRLREKLSYRGMKADGTFKVSKANKYNAEGRWIDGRFFDSKLEADRYGQLMEMQDMGLIDQLECQHPIKCIVNGVLVCTYLADFRYRARPRQFGQQVIIEEVKGKVLDAYRIKKKLVEALHPVEILELKLRKGETVAAWRMLTADQVGTVPGKEEAWLTGPSTGLLRSRRGSQS